MALKPEVDLNPITCKGKLVVAVVWGTPFRLSGAGHDRQSCDQWL
jgi:hypothetical protein